MDPHFKSTEAAAAASKDMSTESRGNELTDAALRRIARLVSRVPLAHTPREFPHVVNRIAAAWDRPERMLALFDELLILDRPARAGFPFAVVAELTELRAYYESRYLPKRTGWQMATTHRDTTGRADRAAPSRGGTSKR